VEVWISRIWSVQQSPWPSSRFFRIPIGDIARARGLLAGSEMRSSREIGSTGGSCRSVANAGLWVADVSRLDQPFRGSAAPQMKRPSIARSGTRRSDATPFCVSSFSRKREYRPGRRGSSRTTRRTPQRSNRPSSFALSVSASLGRAELRPHCAAPSPRRLGAQHLRLPAQTSWSRRRRSRRSMPACACVARAKWTKPPRRVYWRDDFAMGGPGRGNVRCREAIARQLRCNRRRGLSLMSPRKVKSGTERACLQRTVERAWAQQGRPIARSRGNEIPSTFSAARFLSTIARRHVVNLIKHNGSARDAPERRF